MAAAAASSIASRRYMRVHTPRHPCHLARTIRLGKNCLGKTTSKGGIRRTSNDHKHICHSFSVKLTHDGQTFELDVPEDSTILEVCNEQGIQVPHDCTMGVCMVCPAKLITGNVDQGAGMLPDDVAEKGFTLLCTATPTEDCEIETIPEDEILEEVMQQ